MDEPFFVDANIVMYAAGSEHPYRQPCQAALEKIVNEKQPAIISVEVYQEILHRYLSLGLPEKARQVSLRLETLIPIALPVTMAAIHRARQLVERYPGLPARDLLHAAMMLENGISRILSVDRHFDQIQEIQRIDPAG